MEKKKSLPHTAHTRTLYTFQSFFKKKKGGIFHKRLRKKENTTEREEVGVGRKYRKSPGDE